MANNKNHCTLRLVYGEKKHSILFSPQKQTKESFESCVRNLFNLGSNSVILGLNEITKDEDGTLIPLELLDDAQDLFNSYSSYRVVLLNETLPIEASNIFPPVQNDTQQPQQNYSGYSYPDPWQNDEYFYQYGKLTIHGEMLKDEARTVAYQTAFKNHSVDFKDKIVLDLGCGTGILSFFAVEAGAKLVYAVEASSLSEWTELVVASNGLSNKIKVIRGRIEDLQLPEKVDIIVSEWMGTFLIFESMLESLLFARDHWLKHDGLLFPSHASIYLSPVTIGEYWNPKVDFWANKPYGVDMSILIPFAKKCAFEKPIIDQAVKEENLFCSPLQLKFFDLKTLPINEPYEKTTLGFLFKAEKSASMHGFVAWFDVLFRGSGKEKEVILSTKPGLKDTHWHQLLLLFDEPVVVKEGQIIKGTIRYQRNPDLLRHLIFELTFALEGEIKSYSKKFFLWGTE